MAKDRKNNKGSRKKLESTDNKRNGSSGSPLGKNSPFGKKKRREVKDTGAKGMEQTIGDKTSSGKTSDSSTTSSVRKTQNVNRATSEGKDGASRKQTKAKRSAQKIDASEELTNPKQASDKVNQASNAIAAEGKTSRTESGSSNINRSLNKDKADKSPKSTSLKSSSSTSKVSKVATASAAAEATTRQTAAVSGSAKTSSTSTRTSSQKVTTSTEYLSYGGDAGIGRLIWWALAAVAGLIALALIATQCFGSSPTASEAASTPETAVRGPAAVANDNSGDAASNQAASSETDATTETTSEKDATIRDETVEIMELNGFADVSVAVADGEVTLAGSVGSTAEKQSAEAAVAKIDGVISVVNELNITSNDDEPNADEPASTTQPAETPAAEPKPGEPAFNG